MKRISGGQLSLGANATLLSSHAGGPRAAAGDTSFAGQAKQSTQQSRVSPPPAREPTGQVGRHRPNPKDDDSDSSLSTGGLRCRGSSISCTAPHSESGSSTSSLLQRSWHTIGRSPSASAEDRRTPAYATQCRSVGVFARQYSSSSGAGVWSEAHRSSQARITQAPCCPSPPTSSFSREGRAGH
jgi:hypothetical protein